MTREEFEYAIKSCGCFIYRGHIYYEESELIKAFEDMGLIKQEPTDENLHREREQAYMQGYEDASKRFRQEPCEDAISRQAVHEAITRWAGSMSVLIALPTREVRPLLESIHKLPSVKPQEKTGHWIMPVNDDGMSDIIYYQVRCSKCGFDLDPQTWDMELHQYDADKYCPKCGAMMVDEQERSE